MATYGAKRSMWAPFAGAEPAASGKQPPTYGEAISLGPLNQVDESLTFSEGSAYGDNTRKIYKRKFKDGTLTVTSVDAGPEALGAVYGCDVATDGSIAYGGADNAPYGGYGFLINRTDENDKDYVQPVFYLKVKGGVNTSNSHTTQGENITIAMDKILFAVNEANCGKYKVEGPRLESEEEAWAWLSGVFAGTTQIPGLSAGTTQISGPSASSDAGT